MTGCLAQRAAQSLRLPGVRLILGTQRRGEVVELLHEAQASGETFVAVEGLSHAPFERLVVRAHEGHTRATMKIQEGCDRFCAYCIIPYVRGPIRSRPLQEIREEAANLCAAGFRELVLTGIHLTSYGRDLRDGTTLVDAIRAGARRGECGAHPSGLARARDRNGAVRAGAAGPAQGLPAVSPRAAERQRRSARAHAQALHDCAVPGGLPHAARGVPGLRADDGRDDGLSGRDGAKF